jgi:hypothetical protein
LIKPYFAELSKSQENILTVKNYFKSIEQIVAATKNEGESNDRTLVTEPVIREFIGFLY